MIPALVVFLAATDFPGVGEWGFAALVEADGRRLLFDTGARPVGAIGSPFSLEKGIDPLALAR